MGWMRFVSDLVSNLAWPSFAGVVFLALRREISELIPNLRRFKAPGGWEAEFGERAADAQRQSEVLAAPKMKLRIGQSAQPDWVDQLRQVADVSPRAAVLDAFLKVEEQITRLALPLAQPRSGVGRMARVLVDRGIMPHAITPVLDDLVGMRNQAAHYPEFAIPVSAAISYVDAAANLVIVLNAIRTDPLSQHTSQSPPAEPDLR
ncbi:MAG: hypothetical protein ACYCYK_13655 [Candidatus Dormibacteria bacterium]